MDAIVDFLKQGKTMHMMRDSEGHGKPILTGLVAINQNTYNHKKLVKIKNNLFKNSNLEKITHGYGIDLELMKVSEYSTPQFKLG